MTYATRDWSDGKVAGCSWNTSEHCERKDLQVPRHKVQELAVGALGTGYQMGRVDRAVLAVEAGVAAPGPVGPAAAG